MKRGLRSLAVMVMLAALAVTSSTMFAQSSSSGGASTTTAASKDVVVRVISPASQKAALVRWTRSAMSQTPALQLPVQNVAVAADAKAAAAPEAAGPASATLGGAAAPNADAVAQAAYPADWANIANEATSAAVLGELAGSPATYDSYSLNSVAALQTVYPHKWVGRLFFNVPGGSAACSATAISGNVMLTAAHCLYDSTNNVWYSGWVFAPAYRFGNVPYGTFAATQCWVLTAWINLSGSYAINTWTRHDVGVCKMGTNAARQTLNQAVGWAGRQWNASYTRHFFNMGYPVNDYRNIALPNPGMLLRTCVAESFTQTTDTRGMGCNLGPGISGGPWLTSYRLAEVSGYVDGVNSGLYLNAQNMYGARFNSNNIVPLCTAAAC